MGTWWPFVHIGSGNRSAISGDFDELIDLIRRTDVFLCDVLNEHSTFLVRSDLQIIFVLVQQISQFLHIQLSYWDFYSELDVFVGLSDGVEHVPHHSRDYTGVFTQLLGDLALHCVGFARGRLSVRENGTVEALNDAIDDGWGGVAVNFLLRGINVKNLIKAELQRLLSIFIFPILNLYGFVIKQIMTDSGAQSLLSLIEWPESTDHLDIGSRWQKSWFFSHKLLQYLNINPTMRWS